MNPKVPRLLLYLLSFCFCGLLCLSYPFYVWFWRAEKDIYVSGGVKSVVFEGRKTQYQRGQEAWFRVNKWHGNEVLDIEYYDHSPQRIRLYYGVTMEQGQDFYEITPKGVRTGFGMKYKVELQSKPKNLSQ